MLHIDYFNSLGLVAKENQTLKVKTKEKFVPYMIYVKPINIIKKLLKILFSRLTKKIGGN